MKLFGSLTAISFSPIVTIEPRRRKFHCPIKLKIPLPAGYRLETSGNLRLLCSITGGQSKAVWEDVTGSTPLSIHEKCLLFTTTVSARFWLVHCQRAQRCQDAARFAQELWRHLVQVPFMAKFVVFAKRRDINEAQVRVFCMTDDKEEKTLEVQEHFTMVARSRDVEVLDNQVLYLEFGGNLIPAHLLGGHPRRTPAAAANWQSPGYSAQRAPHGGRPNSGLLVANSSVLLNEQLAFAFRAFQENRLAFACRLREVGQEPTGRIAFMEDSLKYLASLNAQQRAYLNEHRRRAVCTLGIQLPAMCVHYDNILGTPKRNSYYANARIGDLSLADIASELNLKPLPSSGQQQQQQQQQQAARSDLDGSDMQAATAPQIYVSGSDLSNGTVYGMRQQQRSFLHLNRPDWMELAPRLGIPRDEVEFIAEHCAPGSQTGAGVTPALLLLMHWYRLASPDDRDQDLARGLLAIGREDIASKLNFPIEPKRISRSTAELLREIEMIPVRSTENLYGLGGGSELSSGYTTGHRNQRATSSARTASSLRRLDDLSNQPNAGVDSSAGHEQERRRRAGSTSSIQKQRQPPQQQQHQQQPPADSYFNSGLRQAGQSYADRSDDYEDQDELARATRVPAIEVSRAQDRQRSLDQQDAISGRHQNQHQHQHQNSIQQAESMPRAAGDAPTSEMTARGTSTAAPTSNSVSVAGPSRRHDGDSLEQVAPAGQRRAVYEQLAQSLLEGALEDAFEHYLRRELQQTAEETVREALAAAGADEGPQEDDEDDGEDQDQDGEGDASETMADDEMSGVSGEAGQGQDEDERTLTHGGRRLRTLSPASTRSPSRLEGNDIFQDLSEMSNFADRIDSILEQTVSETNSTRSGGRMRSLSPMPQFVAPSSTGGGGGGESNDEDDELD